MIELLNHQNDIAIELNDIENFTKSAVIVVPETQNNSLTIAFVKDDEIRSLNRQFRSKDSVTDVLSFPNETDEFDVADNYLGDIVISAEQAQKQALENSLPIELEIKQLILHGILHLCGYNHETDNGEMDGLELKLRDKLCIS